METGMVSGSGWCEGFGEYGGGSGKRAAQRQSGRAQPGSCSEDVLVRGDWAGAGLSDDMLVSGVEASAASLASSDSDSSPLLDSGGEEEGGGDVTSIPGGGGDGE